MQVCGTFSIYKHWNCVCVCACVCEVYVEIMAENIYTPITTYLVLCGSSIGRVTSSVCFF